MRQQVRAFGRLLIDCRLIHRSLWAVALPDGHLASVWWRQGLDGAIQFPAGLPRAGTVVRRLRLRITSGPLGKESREISPRLLPNRPNWILPNRGAVRPGCHQRTLPGLTRERRAFLNHAPSQGRCVTRCDTKLAQ